MNHRFKTLKALLTGVALAAGVMLATGIAFADKLHLKDGTVIEGTVEREEANFVYFKTQGQEKAKLFLKTNVKKIERDGDKPATPAVSPTPAAEPAKPTEPAKPAEAAKPADASKPTDAAKPAETGKPGEKKPRVHDVSGAPRIAILNFGPPSDWQGEAGNMVGTVINSRAWKDVIPLLEKDKVDVVVVRINSGGGYTAEMEPFNRLFEFEYKRRFRTVAWVESAISCAALSPWPIEEFYFLPNGSLGGCTEWSGPMIASKGVQLEMILSKAEQASRWAKRDPRYMRSMQIMDPLTATIDENGNVTLFQDMTGQHTINRAGNILTFTADDAVKYGFAKGIAATKEELAKALGYSEVVWAGKEATDFIDRNMRDNDRAEKKVQDIYQKYEMCAQAAAQLPRDRRMAEIGVARRFLRDMKKAIETNPIIGWGVGIESMQFFADQEERLDQIAQRP